VAGTSRLSYWTTIVENKPVKVSGPVSIRCPGAFKTDCCSHCGSIKISDAIELLRTPGTGFCGSNWKYGWPHKFSIGEGEFYNVHLLEATRDEFIEFNVLSQACFGVEWFDDNNKVMYNATPGCQWWGIIDEDGNPDFSRMRRV
jgi:hypothetical protein